MARLMLKPRSALPQPLVISGRGWNGNDGNWSTVPIRVGSTSQEVFVLVSTSQSGTSVPLPGSCSGIKNCAADRGVAEGSGFVPANSPTWNASSDGSQGRDTIDMSDAKGPILKQQPIFGIESASPFLGSVGLAAAPSGLVPVPYFLGTNSSNSSILDTLKTQGTTPSLSFGYLAGAAYSTWEVTYIVRFVSSHYTQETSLHP